MNVFLELYAQLFENLGTCRLAKKLEGTLSEGIGLSCILQTEPHDLQIAVKCT